MLALTAFKSCSGMCFEVSKLIRSSGGVDSTVCVFFFMRRFAERVVATAAFSF
jgi:hypothetical protein